MSASPRVDEIVGGPMRPLRRIEYDALVERGFFADERVELIHGIVVAMSPQSARHASAIERLTHRLVQALGESVRVRVQLPLAVDEGSEPEPDVGVVAAGDHDHEHPATAFLVVEVADDSLRTDRDPKAALYAAAGVPEYWIVNLADRVLERRTEPSSAAFRVMETLRPGDSVRLVAFPDVSVAVSDVVR